MYEEIEENFARNVRAVAGVVHIDKELVDLILPGLEKRQAVLVEKYNIQNPNVDFSRAIDILRSIREAGSLAKKLEVVRTQAVVLLVSHFGSTVGDLFRAAIQHEAPTSTIDKLRSFDIKMSVAELQDHNFDLRSGFAELFVDKADISFQDMRSTTGAFREYLGMELERDDRMNNIIAAQAFRNAIAHAGAVVDQRLIRQLRSALPRSIWPELEEGMPIEVADSDIDRIARDMQGFVSHLVQLLREKAGQRVGPTRESGRGP